MESPNPLAEIPLDILMEEIDRRGNRTLVGVYREHDDLRWDLSISGKGDLLGVIAQIIGRDDDEDDN